MSINKKNHECGGSCFNALGRLLRPLFSMLIGIDLNGEPVGWISYAKDLTVFNPVISFGFGIMFVDDDDIISIPILPVPVLSITYEFGR